MNSDGSPASRSAVWRLRVGAGVVGTIEPDGPMPDILQGILDLARTLGIETIAEGIEDPHQLSTLRSENCEQGQGFLLAKPMSTDEAHRLFSRSRLARAGRSSTVVETVGV